MFQSTKKVPLISVLSHLYSYKTKNMKLKNTMYEGNVMNNLSTREHILLYSQHKEKHFFRLRHMKSTPC
jgi:hypothetical protein